MNSESLTVVKVGGGLAATPALLTDVARRISRIAARRPLLVMPGGGPFADTVRAFDATYALSPTAGHWMAILAMDQFAFALAGLIPGGRVVEDRAGIHQAHAAGAVPVLAPMRWLRAADELPHSWEVTSDSLAAYLATLLGADELILIKPVPGGLELVDRYFSRVLPAGMRLRVLGAAEAAADDWG